MNETNEAKQSVTITVPEVGGAEAAEATDLLEHLVERYKISQVDADALFSACVAVYLRGRIALGDRPPARCELVDGCGDPNN